MNTMILPNSAEKTMTSREIAELVQARHDNVKKAIDRCVEKGAFDIPRIQGYLDSIGRAGQTEYVLGKRESLIVVAQMCPEFTGRIVDRWQELEQSNKMRLPDFSDPATAARAWADEVEAKQAVLLQLEAAKPALDFVDRYVDASGSKGFRQVCKLLGANENRFREFLLEEKIMYRLGSEWVPHAQHLEAKRFEVKAGTSDSNHAFNQARFTPKGINWVAGLWAQYNLHERAA